MMEALACVKPAALVLTVAAVAIALSLLGLGIALWYTRRSAWIAREEQLRDLRRYNEAQAWRYTSRRLRAGCNPPPDYPRPPAPPSPPPAPGARIFRFHVLDDYRRPQ